MAGSSSPVGSGELRSPQREEKGRGDQPAAAIARQQTKRGAGLPKGQGSTQGRRRYEIRSMDKKTIWDVLRSQKNIWDASLHPPPVFDCNKHHPDDADASPPCSWALLDVRSYIADRCNATTAYGRMRNGGEIQVTFCFAPPPAVSYFCFWCPKATHLAEVGTEPDIIAAEADLVVLRVAFGSASECMDPCNNDIFVYHAGGGGKGPSLRLIEPDDPWSLTRNNIGILRHRNDSIPDDDHYFIVALNQSKLAWQFNLDIFDSKTETWSCRPVSVKGRKHQHRQFRHFPNKAVMLGEGGLMGFVDLWRGILICDVLRSVDLHYVPFPRPLKDNKKPCDPKIARNIVVAQGRIKVVDCFYCSASSAWKASVWSRPAASMQVEEDWNRDYFFQIHNNFVDHNTLNFGLLPNLHEDDDNSLKKVEALHIAHPTLSLDNDLEVYFMAKVSPHDKRAWVLAVDLKNKRIQDVAVFRAERSIGITLSYIHCRISKYFNAAPGIKVDLKRQGMLLRGNLSKKQAGVRNDVVSSTESEEDHMDLD